MSKCSQHSTRLVGGLYIDPKDSDEKKKNTEEAQRRCWWCGQRLATEIDVEEVEPKTPQEDVRVIGACYPEK